MNVAVIGGGIAGISAAWHLQQAGEVTLFEAADRLGGHTDTHSLEADGRTFRVDSGFIVFNETNYPLFSSWLDTLGVAGQPSDMSFSVCNPGTGLEYGTGGPAALLCQPRNLVRPEFLRMVRDLRRFYGAGPGHLGEEGETVDGFLIRHSYGGGFRHDHLIPMCAALWSLPQGRAAELPVGHVLSFMRNHRMLTLGRRPRWRVVAGGSSRYVDAFQAAFRGRVVCGDPVRRVERTGPSVVVRTTRDVHTFDGVVFACHADQSLALIDPTVNERRVLGAFQYEHNRAVLHSDPSAMPRSRRAWSSWNVQTCRPDADRCQVTYWMNRLQGLNDAPDFFVTLNPERSLSPVWAERDYSHPVFTADALRAQDDRPLISAGRRSAYCGSYWGWGFHEDAFSSGMQAAASIRAEMRHAA